MIYRQVIQSACSVDEREAAAIEKLIRVEHPTLDHLTRRQLELVARRAHETLEILRAEDPETADYFTQAVVYS